MLTELNKWTSDQTNGLIKDLLPPGSITSKTNQVYGNALYFKGAWYDKFDKSDTKFKDFHLLNGSSVSVPFMSNIKDYQYVEAYDGRIGGRRGRRGSPQRRIDFVADHPFLFSIREDKTATVLFVGQIFDPSKSSSSA